MIKNIFLTITVLALAFTFNSCEDPEDAFDPVNPDLAVNAVIGTSSSAQSILVGANRQLSLAMDELVVTVSYTHLTLPTILLV